MMNLADETPRAGPGDEQQLSLRLHELRTPLHQIIGLSEMLMEVAEEEGSRDLLGGLNTIREASLELTALLQERLIHIDHAAEVSECVPLVDAVRGAASRVLGYPNLVLAEEGTARLQPFREDLALIRKAGENFLRLTRQSDLLVCPKRQREWESRSLANPPTLAATHLPGARVLVVDDEALNREMLCRRLQREGCRATGAGSGPEALEMLRAERFDAILLDLQMPVMNGIEVLQEMKNDAQLRQLPVIMLSAHTEVERIVRALELGAEDYLPKPVNSVLLRARLNACLEKKKMADELLRAGKLQSIGVLAGGLAHGFNNTLTGVLGNLSLLRHRDDLPAETLYFVREAEQSAIRAQELTRYLLTFAEGGAPVKQVLSPVALVQEVITPLVRGTAVRAELRLPPGLWNLEADPHQVRQVLENIVTNAIEAMPDGGLLEIRGENGEAPPAAARHLPAGPYLFFTIQDAGVGIAPEHLPRVFDPFFTTRQEARGLGLAAAYSIVQRHAGHLGIESALGEGTTVVLALPALRPTDPEPPALEPSSAGAALRRSPLPATARRRWRVLVMDDEEPIRALAEIMLGVLGYSVLAVTNGDEALAAHAEAARAGEPFDIVVMDLTIPGGMGGAETIRRLRERDQEIYAIVASGYSNDPVMSKPLAYGFNSVLPKPYVINDLVRILEKVAPAGSGSGEGEG